MYAVGERGFLWDGQRREVYDNATCCITIHSTAMYDHATVELFDSACSRMMGDGSRWQRAWAGAGRRLGRRERAQASARVGAGACVIAGATHLMMPTRAWGIYHDKITINLFY